VTLTVQPGVTLNVSGSDIILFTLFDEQGAIIASTSRPALNSRAIPEPREPESVLVQRSDGSAGELDHDPLLEELVVRHEHQHGETMLQAMELHGLGGPALEPAPRPQASAHHSGLERVEVPGGPCEIGAPGDAWSYDNERPRHRADIPTFWIGRTSVTNASFLSFAEGGGYERREWWSDEGWAWKEEYDITHHGSGPAARSLDPDEPVVHVSWFEADAFARAHGARLPTELEWEKAATWDHERREARPMPWGDGGFEGRANLDQRGLRPHPAGAYAAGASPCGALGMLGDVWEWTASDFTGYDGFVAHPYREYSEVFFGSAYKVLRGGSWASRARVVSPTFRNWDLPQRRQIFSGFRLAWDRP